MGDLISREAVRLIDANALEKHLINIANTMQGAGFKSYAGAMGEAAAIVHSRPAVDAEPVRLRIDVCDVDEEKGWYRRLFYCPCGQLIKTETWDAKRCFGTGTVLRENKMPKHCPNCGAKMDKEAEK